MRERTQDRTNMALDEGHAHTERAWGGQERLSAIFEIARILAEQPDLESMLGEFLSCLIDTLDAAETGILLLYDAALDRLIVRDAHGYDRASLSQIQVEAGEGMSGHALETGMAALYPTPKAIAKVRENLTSTTRELFDAATTGLNPPRCAACVPLIRGEVKVGVLVLENRGSAAPFEERDLPFLEAVAQLMALSIDNARLRQELQTVQALEEANRFKSELISTLAHEMRTPLTSIKGFSTALLMDEISFDSTTQHEFLEIIDQECDVLTDLIHDLLESSIIDAGLLQLEREPVLIARLAQDVIDDIGRRTQKHRFLVALDRLPIVEADPKRSNTRPTVESLSCAAK